MANPVRIRVRCDEQTEDVWKTATGKHNMNYGEFANAASQFILQHQDMFREFVETEGRDRSRGRR